ncbi:hypothetical protein DFH06DRAFT_1189641 [Mycena polygramma]|nr:hypothetical protein DFH06DRAFT_1189641 [Mycena polygramma]
MSFFTHSSVVVQGGTFYAATGNVNLQNNQHLAIEASAAINSELAQGRRPPAVTWEEPSEEYAVSGSTRDRTEGERFNSYGESKRELSRTSARQQRPSDREELLTLPSQGGACGTNDYVGPHTDPVRDGYGPLLVNQVQADAGAYAPWTNAYPFHPEPTTTIRNGTFISGNVNNTVSKGESGINILHRASATEAFHDPANSHDQPRCHPETRIEMQEKLLNWCLNSTWTPAKWGEVSYYTEPSVLWLRGPAGAGKSAIMTTLSQRLEDEKRLGGTFFFKRGHVARGNAGVLFVTIALQLAVNCVQLKPRISRIVQENPTLTNRSIGVQLRELILNPCRGVQGLPSTIIIDGLDECAGQSVQQEILRLIMHSTRERTPLRFVIASRPEAHIRETLEDPSYHGLYREFDVERCFDDVRRYLVAEFGRIHREHSTMAAITTPWPSEEVVESLVYEASGYFIYASTAIKFVDDKDFRPTQRLEVLLEHRTGANLDSPFGALDELYAQILSVVPKHHQLIPILRVIDVIPGCFKLSNSDMDVVLQLETGDTRLCLRRLHSVIGIDTRGFPVFFHASFSDFLGDPSRAGDFYIGDSPDVQVAKDIFKVMGYNYEDPTKNRNGPLGLSVCPNLCGKSMDEHID